jgi:hypothetical protein
VIEVVKWPVTKIAEATRSRKISCAEVQFRLLFFTISMLFPGEFPSGGKPAERTEEKL